MPYDDPDPTDPMTLHGVAFETTDDGAMMEMIHCFIEEYARLGFDADRILRLFRNPGYVGPYGAYCALGEAAIAQLIAEEVQLRPPVRTTPAAEAESDAGTRVSLPVLGAGY